MNNLEDINHNAWKLAVKSMFFDGRKISCVSKGKVRELLEAKCEGGKVSDILRSYKPDSESKLKIAKNFGLELVNTTNPLGKKERSLLMRYTLWNINILEEILSGDGNIEAYLSAENLTGTGRREILDAIKELKAQSRQRTDRRHHAPGGRGSGGRGHRNQGRNRHAGGRNQQRRR